MLGPLVLLAILSLIGGWIGWPRALGGNDVFAGFLAPVLGDHTAPERRRGASERILAVVSLLVAALGWFLADLLYRQKPALPDTLAAKARGLYPLLTHKYWIDELYSAIIVRPLEAGSRLVLHRGVDETPGGRRISRAAESALGAGGVLRRIQSGNIRSYAGWIAAGAAVLLLT